MSSIEVEIRSLVSKEQYDRLLAFFQQGCDIDSEDHQETHYFDAPVDLRLQQNDTISKIIMKRGELHDEAREEIEVECKREDFAKLQAILSTLGYKAQVKWFRSRHTFYWEGITVTVDDTKGFGYVIELEKLTEEDGKNAALRLLREKCKQLGITEASKEECQKRFKHYAQHWRELTVHENEAS
jgi:predicted adenylyl cyclase CyaB